LPGGERVNVVIPPACERIALTIRKFPAETMTFDILERKGSVNGAVRDLCEGLVLARQSILVAGGTSAGKTSLLNALSRMIPQDERIIRETPVSCRSNNRTGWRSRPWSPTRPGRIR
jgi:pilus assembly protein CpaF